MSARREEMEHHLSDTIALGTVTLGQLLATWAAHDLTHLH